MKQFAIGFLFFVIIDLCFIPEEHKIITPFILELTSGRFKMSMTTTTKGFPVSLKKGNFKRILGEKVIVKFLGKEGGLFSKEKIVVRLYVPPDKKAKDYEFYEGHLREQFEYYRKTYFIDLKKVEGEGDNLEVELYVIEK